MKMEPSIKIHEERPAGITSLDQRSREIFTRLVETYLQTGEPVGSRTISRVLPGALASVASARGAAILAGTASGAYRTTGDIVALAPDPNESVLPGVERGAYEAPYARYRELYPALHDGRSSQNR